MIVNDMRLVFANAAASRASEGHGLHAQSVLSSSPACIPKDLLLRHGMQLRYLTRDLSSPMSPTSAAFDGQSCVARRGKHNVTNGTRHSPGCYRQCHCLHPALRIALYAPRPFQPRQGRAEQDLKDALRFKGAFEGLKTHVEFNVGDGERGVLETELT